MLQTGAGGQAVSGAQKLGGFSILVACVGVYGFRASVWPCFCGPVLGLRHLGDRNTPLTQIRPVSE